MRVSFDVHADGRRLSVAVWGSLVARRPAVVMLHGALDCISTWKDLPTAIWEKAGLPVVAYDRYGHGQSECRQLLDPAYRQREAGLVLGEIFARLNIDRPILFGHSDGGALALLAADAHSELVEGAFVCSPMIRFDLSALSAMESARLAYETGDLRKKLVAHHGKRADPLFWGWYRHWSEDRLRTSNIDDEISRIRCPVYALFGSDDPYSWQPSAEALRTHGRMPLETCVLPRTGHHSHLHDLHWTASVFADFCAAVTRAG